MSIPLSDLALAHEMRQEHKTPWKLIARELGHDPRALRNAINYIKQNGYARI
jgi:hypothetical protein